MTTNKVEIFISKDNQAELKVFFENETVWLTQFQLATLFERDRTVISKHIKNIFAEGELIKEVVCANFAYTTQHGAVKGKTQEVESILYNLDVIISVGYRVKSIRGTQFRQWANQRLKDYLLMGQAINQKRLDELAQMVTIVQQSVNSNELQENEAKGLVNILSLYTQSYVLLNQFDSDNLNISNLNENITYEISYDEAKKSVGKLKEQLIDLKEATELFGKEKDESFKGILGNIIQSFDNQYLYPSIEEQAAHLLYFIIKNHPFSDGNKRIGAFMFVWFLEKNKHQFTKKGDLKINQNGLVALALLIAQSNPNEKELMIKLIINLIKQ